jgi:hypothetical protein
MLMVEVIYSSGRCDVAAAAAAAALATAVTTPRSIIYE